jgi:phage terminase small subunit
MLLTPNQQKFADEYLKTGNATRSYFAAYPQVKKEETAAANSSRLLRNAKVSKYISNRQEKAQARSEITLARQIDRLEELYIASESVKDALSVLQEENKLLGLYAPTKSETVNHNYAQKLAPEEQKEAEAILAELTAAPSSS